jgi:hypothetical protein
MQPSLAVLLAGALLSGCAYSPPAATDPHAVLRLMLTSSSGNYLEADVAIDSRNVGDALLAKGRFNISPGPHTLKVELMSAQRTVGKVRRVYGLGQTRTRTVKMSTLRSCTGGVSFRVARDTTYEIHVADTGEGSSCLIECVRRIEDKQGALRGEKCAMTRRY